MVLCYNCGADGEGMVGAVSVVGSGVARRGVGGRRINHQTSNAIKSQFNQRTIKPTSLTNFLLAPFRRRHPANRTLINQPKETVAINNYWVSPSFI